MNQTDPNPCAHEAHVLVRELLAFQGETCCPAHLPDQGGASALWGFGTGTELGSGAGERIMTKSVKIWIQRCLLREAGSAGRRMASKISRADCLCPLELGFSEDCFSLGSMMPRAKSMYFHT